MAGVLCLVSGILLLLAVPLTTIVIKRVLGYDLRVFSYGLYAVCGVGAQALLAIGAFWGGYRTLRFIQESGSTLIGLSVGSFLAAIFFFGSVFDLAAAALLMWAAVLVFLS